MAQGAGTKRRVRSAQVSSHHGLARFVSLQDFRPVRGGTRVYARFEGLDAWIAEFNAGNDTGFPNRILQMKDAKGVVYPRSSSSSSSSGGSGSTAHDVSGIRGVAFGVGPGSTISAQQAADLLDGAYDREIEHKHPSVEVPREIGRVQWPIARMLQDPGLRIPVVFSLDRKPGIGDPEESPPAEGPAASGAPKIVRFTVVEEGGAPESGGERVESGKNYAVRKDEAFAIAYKVEGAEDVSLDPVGTLEEKEGEVSISPPPRETTTYTLVASRGSEQAVCHLTVEPREGRFIDLAREHELFKEEVHLVETDYAEVKAEFQIKANGTLELGAVEGTNAEWLKRLGEQLKKDCEDIVKLLDPSNHFYASLNGFEFEGFAPEITHTKEGYELKCKLVGKFKEPEIEVEATAILLSIDEEHGKIDPHGPELEFAVVRKLNVTPDFVLAAGKAVCKDLGLSAEGKLIVEPRWGAIARWVLSEAGMDAALTVGFFVVAVAPVVELIVSCMTTLEWQRMRASVPDFADRYTQGYMDALDGKAEAGDPAYSRAWEDGWNRSKKAIDKFGFSAYSDWLQQNRGKVEESIRRQALILARRAAWEQYNSKSRAYQDQRGAWLWIYDKTPARSGELKLFQDFCDPSAPAYFKNGNW